MKKLILSLVLVLTSLFAMAQKGTFEAGKGTFLLNGKPFIVKAAEVHYPRIPRPYWEHRIQMCKALGMNAVCIYIFWNIHEQKEGQFDFTGNSDVAEFCRLAQKNGLYIIVRPGPYVCRRCSPRERAASSSTNPRESLNTPWLWRWSLGRA